MEEKDRWAQVRRLSPDVPRDLDGLIEALGDPAWRVRAAAVDALGTARPEVTVFRLAALLGARDEVGTRDAAAHALVLMGEPSVDAVRHRLDNPDPGVRKLSLDVLGRIGSTAAAAAVAGRLADANPNVRAAAAEALGGIDGPVAREALLGALGSGDRLLLACALEALERIGAEPPLAAVLSAFTDPLLRRRALPLLARRSEEGALAAVVSALDDPARSVRVAALAAVSEIYRSSGAERRGRLVTLVASLRRCSPADALQAPDEGAAEGALLVLGWRKEAGAAAEIARAADRPDLRGAAEEALRRLGPDAKPALRAAFSGLGTGGRAAVLEVLARQADPVDLDLCVTCARGGDPAEVRLPAIRALGRIPGGVDALLERLGDPPPLSSAAADALVHLAGSDPETVRSRVRAQRPTPEGLRLLGRIGEASDREALRAAVAAPDPELRGAALESLPRLNDPQAARALVHGLVDESPLVRVAAARGLAILAPWVEEPIEAALGTALEDADVHVAAAAAEALGDRRAGTAALRDALGKALERGSPRSLLALACVRGLGAAGDHEGLLPAFDSADPEVVKTAAAAAGPLCVAPLTAALRHPGWDVRRAAADALWRNGSTAAVARLREVRAGEKDPQVIEALDRALHELAREPVS